MQMNNLEYFVGLLSEVNLCLYKEEKKPSANIHPAWDQWFSFESNSQKFFGFYSNPTVYKILEGKLLAKASENNPELFNNGNAYNILKAICIEGGLNYKPPTTFDDTSEESQDAVNESFLKDFYFIITDERKSKTLRLDLFRVISPTGDEFTGGLLHAFKHFVQDGKSISVSSEPRELPMSYLREIIDCLFTKSPKEIESMSNGNKKNIYEIEIQGKKYRLVFFHNTHCDVFFLNTIIPI